MCSVYVTQTLWTSAFVIIFAFTLRSTDHVKLTDVEIGFTLAQLSFFFFNLLSSHSVSPLCCPLCLYVPRRWRGLCSVPWD